MKILGRLLFVILIALLLGGALFYCIKQKFETPITIKTPIEITIPKGTGLNKTAQILATNKLIDDARWFILYARMKKISSQLKAGEYYFNNTTSIQNIAHRLVKGDTIVRSITIPEGKALVEIKKIIQENNSTTSYSILLDLLEIKQHSLVSLMVKTMLFKTCLKILGI